jgi:ubiquinone/menaquinone biosynthesis C-methylase UbiE
MLRWLGADYERILEVGCGSGEMLPSLRARSKRVVGLDVSGAMLSAASRRTDVSRGVHLAAADVQQLPFPACSFEAVICMGVLEYVPDVQRTLHEMHRVLRPGGLLAATLPHKGCLVRNVGLVTRGLYRRACGKSQGSEAIITRYRTGEFDRILRSAGFQKLQHDLCGVRLIPWPLSEMLPNVTRRFQAAAERIRVLASRPSLAGVYCVAAQRN